MNIVSKTTAQKRYKGKASQEDLLMDWINEEILDACDNKHSEVEIGINIAHYPPRIVGNVLAKVEKAGYTVERVYSGIDHLTQLAEIVVIISWE